jgi:hypothetical protein
MKRALATLGALGVLVAPLSFAQAAAADTPCPTIGYQINVPEQDVNWVQPNGDPSVDVMAVRDAVAVLEMHTGFTYRYDGMTTWVASYSNVAVQPDDLEITLTPGDNTSFNTPHLAHAAAYTQLSGGKAAIVMRFSGMSGIDGPYAWQGGNTLFTTTEHELGHSLGLMHSLLPGDIMYGGGMTQDTPQFYSVNDQRNLAAVGCHPTGTVTDTAP